MAGKIGRRRGRGFSVTIAMVAFDRRSPVLPAVPALGENRLWVCELGTGGPVNRLVLVEAAAGLLSLLLLWVRPRRPSRREVIAGLLAFGALWLGAGLLGHVVWLPWLLIPRRLLLWPPGALLMLPWFMAAGQVMQSAGRAGRAGWWVAQSGVVVMGLLLAVRLSPELGVLVLMAPAVPCLVGLHALAGWPYALSGALWVSWVFLAIFPLQ